MDIQLEDRLRCTFVLTKGCGTKGSFLDCQMSLPVDRSAALIRRQAVPLKMPYRVNTVRLDLDLTSVGGDRFACGVDLGTVLALSRRAKRQKQFGLHASEHAVRAHEVGSGTTICISV